MKIINIISLIFITFGCYAQCEDTCIESDKSHCTINSKATDEFIYFVEFYDSQIGDITQELKKFIDVCITSGRSGYIHQGDFTITESLEFIGADIDLEFDLNCIISSSANMNDAMFIFRESSVRIEGGQFDARLSPFGLNVQSVTCLSFASCDKIRVTESKFFGIRANRPTDPGQFGDSGITAVDSYHVHIENCEFYGMPDLGIYMTGNNNADRTDDGGYTHIINNDFIGCSSGVSFKRQATEATITGNIVKDSFVGMSCFPSGGNDIAGDRVIFTNNHYINCERGLELRGGDGYVIASNNYFESNTLMAIRLQSVSNCSFVGNIFNQGSTAFLIQQSTYGIPSNNLISNNLISNFTNAINEQTGSGANFYSYNLYGGANVIINNPQSIVVDF